MILTETLRGIYNAEQKKEKKKERKPIIFFIKTKIFRSYLLQCNVATTSVIVCPLREENKELLKIFVNFLGQVVLQFLMNFYGGHGVPSSYMASFGSQEILGKGKKFIAKFIFYFLSLDDMEKHEGKINLKENANENEVIFSLLFLKINEESGKKSCFATCLCNIWFLIMYVCL